MLEIELKFRTDDLVAAERTLRDMGAELLGSHAESDTYFNAPDRDFAKTGEAVRIRRSGAVNKLTYKGPKRPNARVKTRTEVEMPLPYGDTTAEVAEQFLAGLGYKPVATVRKDRKEFHLPRGQFAVTACLDDVEQVGHYVELEILCEPPRADEAQTELLKLAEELGLTALEKHSYLQMLLMISPEHAPRGGRP
ncbi:MAG TPA: class IV adenylate cyclase [Fimbriiglobus sp.]|jgi:adenylate cyclase class 2